MGTEYYKTTAPTLPSYYYQPPAHHCALHHHAIPSCCIRPFSTSVQWTSKANLATYTRTHTQKPVLHQYYVHSTYPLFWAESSISSILTYVLTSFFWFYLSSVVEVKGKRE